MRRLVDALFYGNYFVGLIAVCLTVEATLQLGLPTPPLAYFLTLFLGTVWFYTHAYRGLGQGSGIDNPRGRWFAGHRVWLRLTQPAYLAGSVVLGFMLLAGKASALAAWPGWLCTLVLSLPLAAWGYYGANTNQLGTGWRRVGWLKPLLIGYVWAGVVTLGPVLWVWLEHPTLEIEPAWVGWFFVKNLGFVGANAVLFDIKDYATDANQDLKTLVVRFGLRRTIYGLVIPLTLLGVASAVGFGLLTGMSLPWRILNLIPFGLTLWLAHSLHVRRPILYYLIAIDGLLLVKGACGMAGVWLSRL